MRKLVSDAKFGQASLLVLMIWFALAVCSCQTVETAGRTHAGSASASTAPTTGSPGTTGSEIPDAQTEPATRFVVQIMKADQPACFSPDDRFMVSKGDATSPQLQLWDVAAGRLLRTFEPDTAGVNQVRWDPQNRYIMVVNAEDQVRLVDFRTGQTTAVVDPKRSGTGVYKAEFTRDGRFVLLKRLGLAPRLFDVDKGQEHLKLAIPEFTNAGGLALAPDGKRLLAGVGQPALNNFRLEWWDLSTGRKLNAFTVPGMVMGGGSPMAISPDGRYVVRIVTRYKPNFQYLTEIIDLERRQVSHLPGTLMGGLHFSADSRFLFAKKPMTSGPQSEDAHRIRMISLAEAKVVNLMGPRYGQDFAVGKQKPMIAWTRSIQEEPDVHFNSIVLSDFENQSAQTAIRGIRSGQTLFKEQFAFLTEDQALLAFGQPLNLSLTRAEPQEWPDGAAPTLVSGDKSKAIISGYDHSTRTSTTAWCSWPDREPLQEVAIRGGQESPTIVPEALSHDGRRLLFWGTGGPATLRWGTMSLEDGQPLWLTDVPQGESGYWREDGRMALSPDGKVLANCYSEGHKDQAQVYLWDAASGKRKGVLRSSKAVFTYGPSFSPDSRYLAISVTHMDMDYEGGAGHWLFGYDYYRALWKKRVEIWNIKTKRRVRVIKDIPATVGEMYFGPDSAGLYVGCDNGMIYKFSVPQGKLVAAYATGSPVAVIRIHPASNRMLVKGPAAVSLWDLNDSRKLFSFYAYSHFENNTANQEFLAWTPEGYYRGSDHLARQFVHLATPLKSYAIDQFFEQFYNPAMIEARIRGLSTGTLNIADLLAESPPPIVALQHVETGVDGRALFKIRATDTGGGVREIRFFHNGKRLGDGRWQAVKTVGLTADGNGIVDRGLASQDQAPSAQGNVPAAPLPAPVSPGDKEETFTVQLMPGENILRATAFSEAMLESEPGQLLLQHEGRGSQGILHVVAVGIEKYQPPLTELGVAADDARGFVHGVTQRAEPLFGNFKAVALYDADATRNGILTALAAVAEKAAPRDTLAFFYAGHGVVMDHDGRFYLVAHGVRSLEVGAANAGAATITREGISDLDLGSALQRIHALKQVVFLDACQSGGADFSATFSDSGQEIAVKRVGRAAGTWIFSAAGKTEYAYETGQLGHGLFTHALLSGLAGRADSGTKDGTIRLGELAGFVSRQVKEYARKLDIQQQPTIQKGMNDFALAISP